MSGKLFYIGIALCLCCAPSFAQSSYPTARSTPRYNSASRTFTTSGQNNGNYSNQTSRGSSYNNSYGRTNGNSYNNSYDNSYGRINGSSYNNSYGRTNGSSYNNSYGRTNGNSYDNSYGRTNGNSYGNGYYSGSGVQRATSYTIMTPQCPITQSLVIPATGGYIHTLGCPSVARSRGTFMYAEDAAQRGVRPTGTCPQCRAVMTQPAVNQQQLTADRNAAVREDALRRLEAQQNRNRVEKRLQEIEDNRRWDNKMAQWENKQPMYIQNNNRGITVYNNSAFGNTDDGGRIADTLRTSAIINANNSAARSQSDAVMRVNGY